MWVEWIRRTHAQGMRVMVALATNNRTLAGLVHGDPPTDDRGSADLQIAEIKSFAQRNHDFMRVVKTPAELRAAVRDGKLAVVLGVELDDLGNFASRAPGQVTAAEIAAEVARLEGLGVRYFFPIHLTNNQFGGTALYEDFFIVMDRLQTGRWLDMECSPHFRYRPDIDGIVTAINTLKLGALGRPVLPGCLTEIGRDGVPRQQGLRNALGLTSAGKDALRALMQRGLLIDVDHMSERAVDDSLKFAREFESGWGYPLVSGHNGAREEGGVERQLRADQLVSIRDAGGMLGLGWAGDDVVRFRSKMVTAQSLMGPGRVALGTDMNGLESHVQPPGALTSVTGTWTVAGESRTWSFQNDGVANYGMIPDLVSDLRATNALAAARMSGAAESFARVWERAQASKLAASRARAAAPTPSVDVITVAPPATDFFCPSAVLAGDREFDGHGPELWADAQLRIAPNGAAVADLSLRARETVSDWSETRGSWQVVLSPPGRRVAEILSATRSETHVISTPAGFQILGPGANPNLSAVPPVTGDLVRAFEIVGDTGGPDISDDNNCNDDTRMRVVFNPVRLRLAP
ncbi:MAG: hypothetical protein RLZZ450_2320 [Pseudomonadota bacterium]|jgi:microsomal dipeptidase-like Zn-dependent dipeptidase